MNESDSLPSLSVHTPIVAALEDLIVRIPAAVALLDSRRRVLHANPQMTRMLRRDADDARSLDWERFVHPIDQGSDQTQFRAMCRGEVTSYHVEQRMRRGDETEFWARVSFSVADPADMASPTLMVIVEDISDVRRLAASVVERRKEMAAMSALARRLIEAPDPRSSAWLQHVADLVPPSFQWPAHTAAAVQLGAHSAHSAGYQQRDAHSTSRIRSDWVDGAGATCFLEAVYTGPDTGVAPFLPEEYALIDSLAELLRLGVRTAELVSAREREP